MVVSREDELVEHGRYQVRSDHVFALISTPQYGAPGLVTLGLNGCGGIIVLYFYVYLVFMLLLIIFCCCCCFVFCNGASGSLYRLSMIRTGDRTILRKEALVSSWVSGSLPWAA